MSIDITSTWKDDGFIDLSFNIVKFQDKDPNYYILDVEGLYKEGVVGLGLVVKKGMKPGFVGGEIDSTAFVKEGISFQRKDIRSDNLILALANIYKITIPSKKFVEKISLTAFALESDPVKIHTSHLNFKVFHDVSDVKKYWEMYIHIDLPNKRLELHEKDEDYRKAIINTLSE